MEVLPRVACAGPATCQRLADERRVCVRARRTLEVNNANSIQLLRSDNNSESCLQDTWCHLN